MLNVCEDAGYEVVVHACHVENEGLVDDVVRFVNRANLDGVLVLPPVSDIEELADKLDDMGTRFVRFSSRLGDKPWKQVVTDYMPAIMDMTGYLVGLGHRDFGFITGPPSHVSSQKRHEVFEQALESHGLSLSPSFTAEGAFTYESGLKAAKKLLSRKKRPTAIFAANDEMAFGVMNVANEMGIKIPDDLSLIGFDGTAFSTFVIPSLSTIMRQTSEMARLGTQKLLALINDGADAAGEFETMVSPRFVPRGSTGPAPKS
jgi:LacI family transcriptional regulator